MQFFEPKRIDRKVVVQPPGEAVDEAIAKWESSLIGQFLDKAPSFLLVKRFVEALWGQYGLVEVFALDNGMFLFRFPDTRVETLFLKLDFGILQTSPSSCASGNQECNFLIFL